MPEMIILGGPLLWITQLSSTVALVLLVIAVAAGIIAYRKFTKGPFRKSILLSNLFLAVFSLAVAAMALYHWSGSELMENLWYLFLNAALVFGIVSSVHSLGFWKGVKVKK